MVKIHGFGTAPDASELPARSVAPVAMVAVYWVLGRRLAFGVNVAMKSSALYDTVPTTEVDPGPVRVKVEVLIVSGFIASLKVPLTAALMSTFVAVFAGDVDTNCGGVVSGAVPVVKVQM